MCTSASTACWATSVGVWTTQTRYRFVDGKEDKYNRGIEYGRWCGKLKWKEGDTAYYLLSQGKYHTWKRGAMSTSKPTSAKPVAMTFCPRSCPSCPICSAGIHGVRWEVLMGWTKTEGLPTCSYRCMSKYSVGTSIMYKHRPTQTYLCYHDAGAAASLDFKCLGERMWVGCNPLRHIRCE